MRYYRIVLPLLLSALCSSLPVLAGGKARVAVVEFKAKVPKAHRQLGTAMTDLLIDELVKTGLYSVLERTALDKVKQEQKLTISDEVDAATGAQFGKLVGAEFLIVGAVTKFEEKEKKGLGGIFGKKLAGGVAQSTAELAITVRIINSTSGEILASEKVSQKETAIGVAGVTSIGGIPLGGALFKSKAMQTALEKAIADCVLIITTKLPTPDPYAIDTALIEVEVKGVNFKQLKTFGEAFEALDRVANVDRSFSNNVGLFKVSYAGSSDELVEAIDGNRPEGMKFEITGFSDKKVELGVK